MKIVLIDIPKHLASSIQFYLSPSYEIVLRSHINISEDDLDADICFFNFNIGLVTFIDKQEFIFNLLKKFQGKICYTNTSDLGICSKLYNTYEDFFKNVYCVLVTTETDYTRAKFRRRILYPKFTIDYIPSLHNKKINRIYFRGSLTGGTKLFGKNHRIETIKKLDKINANWADCKLFASELQKTYHSVQQLLQDSNNKLIIDSLSADTHIQKPEYLKELSSSVTSLCLPGNAIWCYRHLESMALNCNIISLSVDYDPGYWIGRDELDECFNILNFDLSNLHEICEYTLNENTDLKERRDYAYSIYQQYYELAPANHYKLHIWNKLKQDMQKHLILP